MEGEARHPGSGFTCSAWTGTWEGWVPTFSLSKLLVHLRGSCERLWILSDLFSTPL